MYRGAPDQETLNDLKRFLKELEGVLQENGNKFFQAGDAAGAVDFLIWPWFERIGGLRLMNPGEEPPPPPPQPLIPIDEHHLFFLFNNGPCVVQKVLPSSLRLTSLSCLAGYLA